MKFEAWDALKTENNVASFSCDVTGRRYVFEGSAFPTNVFVGENDILYSPFKLCAVFEDGLGKWDKKCVIPMKANEEKAVYEVSQCCKNVILNAKVEVEFDGFIKIDFNISNFWSFHKEREPKLKGLYIDIPVKKEFSTLMHFWPNCESGVCLSYRILNSHSTPEGTTFLPFKPYIWTGWEYGGIGICCESDKGFQLSEPDKCIEIERGEKFTNIRINILDSMPENWQGRCDEWGNTLNPITYSFGIQATPVKKFPKDNVDKFRAFHLYNVPRFPIFEKVSGSGNTLLEKIADHGINWIILHEDWTLIQNYGLPENEEKFKTFVDDCHSLGIKVMVYFGYEISTMYPDFNDICHGMLNKNVYGNFVGGWQREPMQRDFTVCYAGDYSAVMIERVKYVMDNYGVDGIYTDGTYVPWECANEEHGCGYRDKAGKLCYAYPIYSVREHVKKLYEAVHERGGIIDTHQSSCCMMPTLAFADSYFDGENLQSLMADDLANMKLDTFRTEFMGENMGISCNLIAYAYSERFTMRLLAGISLLHNVFPRANTYENLAFSKKIWDIYDEFGVSDSKWHPYWKQKEFAAQENVHISYFENSRNEILLLITSLNRSVSTAKMTYVGNYKEIQDLLDKNQQCRIAEGELYVPVEYGNIKICVLK